VPVNVATPFDCHRWGEASPPSRLRESPRPGRVRALFPQTSSHRDGSPYLWATNVPVNVATPFDCRRWGEASLPSRLRETPRPGRVRAVFPQPSAHRDGSPYPRATNVPGSVRRRWGEASLPSRLGESPRPVQIRALFPQPPAHRDGSPYLWATNVPGSVRRRWGEASLPSRLGESPRPARVRALFPQTSAHRDGSPYRATITHRPRRRRLRER